MKKIALSLLLLALVSCSNNVSKDKGRHLAITEIENNATVPETENNTGEKSWKLVVAEDKRMLKKKKSGAGFFWLADTAWYMFSNISTKDMKFYINKRKEQGFNVIQVRACIRYSGGDFKENLEKKRPFSLIENLEVNGSNYNHPNEEYWKTVDQIIKYAETKDMYIALLPTWGAAGSKIISGLKNETEAKIYSEFIAQRYKDYPNIIWVNGGDDVAHTPSHRELWDILGNTIDDIAGDNHLVTYHRSNGIAMDSEERGWFSKSKWLDFYMVESGHCSNSMQAQGVLLNVYDHNGTSKRPSIDGEPAYETIQATWCKDKNLTITAAMVRETAYTQVFSGAFGHTYGHQSVWSFADGKTPDGHSSIIYKDWKSALNDNGAIQMGYLAKLMRSRPIVGRVPAQEIIISDKDKAIATKGKGYALVYLYKDKGKEVWVDLSKVAKSVKAWWYDPTTGDADGIGTFSDINKTFTWDTNDDRVLVLDDASKTFDTPGQ